LTDLFGVRPHLVCRTTGPGFGLRVLALLVAVFVSTDQRALPPEQRMVGLAEDGVMDFLARADAESHRASEHQDEYGHPSGSDGDGSPHASRISTSVVYIGNRPFGY